MVDPLTGFALVPAKAASRMILEPLVSVVLGPRLEALKGWAAKKQLDAKLYEHHMSEGFYVYLQQLHERCRCLSTLAIRNERADIRELYVPLTLVAPRGMVEWRIEISKPLPFERGESLSRILVADNAGMGKSTLTRALCLAMIERASCIPILIDLRHIKWPPVRENDTTKLEKQLVEALFAELDPLGTIFDRDLGFALFEQGGFAIILDGLDEVPSASASQAIKAINLVSKKLAKNTLVVTSRPSVQLISLNAFQLFHIRPLKRSEAFDLIRNYDHFNENRFSERLISEIERSGDDIASFLENPFLVSLLYKSFTYNLDLPARRADFYQEVFHALYKSHDLTKDGFRREKKSGLSLSVFASVVGDLAFESLKDNCFEYHHFALHVYLERARRSAPEVEFGVDDVIDDLTESVPLLLADGPIYKWGHRSLQEYFAAQHVSLHPQKRVILEAIIERDRGHFVHMLDLFREIDNRSFAQFCIPSILRDFIRYVTANFQTQAGVDDDLVRERVEMLYGIPFVIYVTNDLAYVSDKLVDRGRRVAAALARLMMRGDPMLLDRLGLLLTYTAGDQVVNLSAPLRILDDTPNNPVNSPMQYRSVNGLLAIDIVERGWKSQAILNYLKCVTHLNTLDVRGTSDADDVTAGI